MMTEMPKKYWKNLPEADLIPGLIAGAEARVLDMGQKQATTPCHSMIAYKKLLPVFRMRRSIRSIRLMLLERMRGIVTSAIFIAVLLKLRCLAKVQPVRVS